MSTDTPPRDLGREIAVMLGDEESLVGYSPEVAHLRYMRERNDELGDALACALFQLAQLGYAAAIHNLKLLGLDIHAASTLVLPTGKQVIQ